MKTLTKLALLAAFLTTAVAAQAEWVSGYTRRDGTYVQPYHRSDAGSFKTTAPRDFTYRNPYAATPSVQVDSYFRNSGTYVAPHVRTPANGTITDNLNYRGYGTIRVPRY